MNGHLHILYCTCMFILPAVNSGALKINGFHCDGISDYMSTFLASTGGNGSRKSSNCPEKNKKNIVLLRCVIFNLIPPSVSLYGSHLLICKLH
jgi:hypothetical protein